MRIPERAKPPKGGVRAATGGKQPPQWPGSSSLLVCRGRNVRRVGGDGDAQSARSRGGGGGGLEPDPKWSRAHCPTHQSRPGTEGVAERMLVNAPQRVSKSRRFFSDLIAARHLQARSVPGSPRRPSGLRGSLGWMGGPVKSVSGPVDGGKGQASRPPCYAAGVTEAGPVARRPRAPGKPIRRRCAAADALKAAGNDAGRRAADAERRQLNEHHLAGQ
jgi:hypothetical protein